MIGIIFAQEEEINGFLKLVNLDKKNKIFDIIFYECNYNKKKLILLESGMGKVNAARACQLLIDNYDIDYVFNVGVAGSVDNNVNILDIVIGEKLVQHDFDVTGFGHEKGYVPKVGVYAEADSKLVKLAKKIDENAHAGVIASGDQFIIDHRLAKKFSTDYNALCVEMEGASIAQVCLLSKVPFIVIRSISDSAIKEINNKIDYDEFLEISCEKVSKYLVELINEL